MATPKKNPKFVVVTIGGVPWRGPPPSIGPDVDCVIAADSGICLALEFGLVVDVLIGDLDSAPQDAISKARRLGVRIEQHDTNKEATDFELALDYAISLRPGRVVVLGGTGGRLSHTLGNATLLAHNKYRPVPITWITPDTTCVVAFDTDGVEIVGRAGDLVSIIPLQDSHGVTTSGLRWPLVGETLFMSSSRGVSNQLAETVATIELSMGTLLVIHERSPI